MFLCIRLWHLDLPSFLVYAKPCMLTQHDTTPIDEKSITFVQVLVLASVMRPSDTSVAVCNGDISSMLLSTVVRTSWLLKQKSQYSPREVMNARRDQQSMSAYE